MRRDHILEQIDSRGIELLAFDPSIEKAFPGLCKENYTADEMKTFLGRGRDAELGIYLDVSVFYPTLAVLRPVA